MQFKSLENTPIMAIVECFNQAFSDYFVPLIITKSQLEQKQLNENGKLNLSVGVLIMTY
jgi:hypothetical protein